MEKEQDLISVIVPVYNIKEYLERCVDSILAQTWKNLEVLLVDDGSIDGTEKLVDELTKKDARIRVFHKENGGSSSARNLGIRKAEGKYLGFVDSDDYIEPFMYERLYRAIKETGIPIAQGGRCEIDEQGNSLPDICTPPDKQTVYDGETFMRELLLHKGDCSFCTKLIDASLFDNREFPEGRLNEDFYVLVQMLPEIEGIVSVPERVYNVFYKIGSNTRTGSAEKFSRVYGDCVDNADMVAELVKEHYPKLEKTSMRFGLYQRLEYLLHIPIREMKKTNGQYSDITKYLKENRRELRKNEELTGKQKLYLMLFSFMPVMLRKGHRCLMRIKAVGKRVI
ncbi:MAG: glycosyltransferase [Lachnospiraceae bacterium]|nr:glycosyltransferase [Lachnospiraceae bacterium]